MAKTEAGEKQRQADVGRERAGEPGSRGPDPVLRWWYGLESVTCPCEGPRLTQMGRIRWGMFPECGLSWRGG